MARWFVIAECTFFVIFTCYSQTASASSCSSAKSSDECMLLGPMCGWCQQEMFASGNPRCDLIENLRQNGCTQIVFETGETLLAQDLDCGSVTTGCTNGRTMEDDALCRLNSSSIVCSGRGTCCCGECICFPRPNQWEIISGTYCECDNFSCDRYKGELCGGPDRGICVCDEQTKRSKCMCNEGFDGDACECSTITTTCLASNGEICSGNGQCMCGECRCDANSPYRGHVCEECPTCPGTCEVNGDCVECKAFGTGLNEMECNTCPHPVITVQDLPTSNDVQRCVLTAADKCAFIFAYETLANGTFVLWVQANKVCPIPPDDGATQPEDGATQPENGTAQPEDDTSQPRDGAPVIGLTVGIIFVGVIVNLIVGVLLAT